MNKFKQIVKKVTTGLILTMIGLIVLFCIVGAIGSLIKGPGYDLEACSSPSSTSCGSDERVSDRFTTPDTPVQ